ncbi:MAG: fumarylacetoacetate hydrolase family protein [Acidobacteria bacterium]|nr:fumarylacetoacetate hydrolase family protein [Acidobacteriota bacterium]
MRLCRFTKGSGKVRVGLAATDRTIFDLTGAGVDRLTPLLEADDVMAAVSDVIRDTLPSVALATVHLLAPVEQQEVWAAGVTYLRSKTARMEESDFSATAYDRVYDAERPEIFFKSLPEKVVGPGDTVGIRADARWNVPEPELALVINSRGRLVGCTIGNDMSSRDIEGENLLYLPQAKVYARSCALGPWITIGSAEDEIRTWTIRLDITRGGQTVFSGQTSVGQIKRRFDELVGYLFRSQAFPNGAVLLTGTGVVPDESFTLAPGDRISIGIDGIGVLDNTVTVV